MRATGEENLYYEMESKTETEGVYDVYDDIVGSGATSGTTQKAVNKRQTLPEVEQAYEANIAEVRRMISIVSIGVVLTFVITVATLALVVSIKMSHNEVTTLKDAAAVHEKQHNEPETVTRGLHPYVPAHSCKEILDLNASKANGEYWIDPEKSGNPLKVYCHMTTDGGGWLLVSSAVTKGPSPPQVSVETKYRGISGDQMVLTKDAMNELRTHLSFTQLRFHCSKLQGRTFHVTTAANRTGEAVVQYFSGQTDVQPAASGSFVTMENDNSRLLGVYEKWGYEKNSHLVGKWGHERGQSRLYDHPAFVETSLHWLIQPGGARWECDDYLVGVSTGDFWKVFAR